MHKPGGLTTQAEPKAPPSATLSACSPALICRESKAFRPPRRRRSPPGRGRPPETEAEAAFLAGAALCRLDAAAQENPPWAGVFRRRLTLKRRRRKRLARRPRRGRGGAARRLSPAPAGRRSRARGTAAHRLAGTHRPLDRALAFVFSTPPPRFWGSRMTRPCKRRSTPPRPAPEAIGRRRSPRRRSLPSPGAP